MTKPLPCTPGTNPETGEWMCAVCKRSAFEDCDAGPHIAHFSDEEKEEFMRELRP